jgi:hypothetical protein
MDHDKAIEILEKMMTLNGERYGDIDSNGYISCMNPYIWYNDLRKCIHLDGRFTADQLEALVWWMRNIK